MTKLSRSLSVITSNINGLNSPIKRLRLTEQIKHVVPLYAVYKRPTLFYLFIFKVIIPQCICLSNHHIIHLYSYICQLSLNKVFLNFYFQYIKLTHKNILKMYNFSFFFYTFIIYLFFYLFIGCVGSSSLCEGFPQLRQAGATLFIAVRGSLTIPAPPVAEHRLQSRRLSSCGSRAQPLRGMWDPPRPGLEPVCPALAGRLSTTAPPGKPPIFPF